MTNLQKPDLSKDTTGPFVVVTRYSSYYIRRVIKVTDKTWTYSEKAWNGKWHERREHGAPPSGRFQTEDEAAAAVVRAKAAEAEHDPLVDAAQEALVAARRAQRDAINAALQGVPVDGSTVRRVEP